VKRAISDIDRTLPVTYKVFKTEIREGLLPERLMATLSSAFGFLAVLLATVGLYGLMAHLVTRRRNEIGIRMALGADRVDVITMVLREAGSLLLIGLMAGAVLTLGAGRWANTLLYGVAAWDPLSLVVAIGSLITIGFTAAFFPAIRAAHFNPVAALREE
jgi:ABC-type antimicrobial peptide transport system permease subunit